MATQKNPGSSLSDPVRAALTSAAATAVLMGTAGAIGLAIVVLFEQDLDGQVSQDQYAAFQRTRPPAEAIELTYADIASLRRMNESLDRELPSFEDFDFSSGDMDLTYADVQNVKRLNEAFNTNPSAGDDVYLTHSDAQKLRQTNASFGEGDAPF